MENIGLDWRWVLTRGILGISFGILVLLFPAAALWSVSVLFAFYVAVDGVMALTASWAARNESGWGFLLFEGIIGIVAGCVAIVFPGVALMTMILLMSAWALGSGVAKLYGAFTHRDRFASPMLLGLAGLVAVVFSVFMLLWPIGGAVVLLTTLAVYSFVFGCFLTAWSFRLRQQQHHPPTTAAHAV